MRSAAAAFAWEFRQRLRWGLIALAVYFAALALVQFVILGERSPIHPLRSMTFAFTVSVPVCAGFLYFMAVFSYGLAGDLTARHSLYPARMFTLPISTGALAGWPMLYGTIAMAALWAATAVIGLWPVHAPVPLVWPGVFAATLVAWLQVLTWMPYGLPALRMIAAVLLLTMIDVVVFTAIELQVRESVMVLIMLPQVPLAYLAARYAVARARRGETPDWRGAFAPLGRVAGLMPRRRGPFPSSAEAQRWFEWRQHGRSLPAWVAIVAPFEVLFLYIVRHEPLVLTVIGLITMLLTPPFVAAFVAVAVGRTSPDAGSAYGLAPFVATRPLSTRALVAEKLRVAATSTLWAWLLVLLAIVLGLTLSGRWPDVVGKAGAMSDFFGPPRASVLALLGVLGLVTVTWKQLVQGLAIGLTGREGLVKASVLVRLSWLVVIGLLFYEYNLDRDLRVFLWNALTWLPLVPSFFKVCAAVWIATHLHRHRLVDDRTLMRGAAAWLAVVLALYGVFYWFFDTPLIADSFKLSLAILAVPVVRPSAVLLALASNRHRGTVLPIPAGTDHPVWARRVALALLAAPLVLSVAMFVSFHVRQRDNGRLVSGGDERTYLLHVPQSYDPRRPTPLVISLHGGALWGAAQMDVSGWNAVADEHGFIVVYPSGLRTAGPRAWRSGQGGPTSRDVRFIADLIDTLAVSYNVDPARIYADGLSNGGGMAFLLSCTLGDRIAAVGMVGPALFLPWRGCDDIARPVPMILFHGTAERFAPYHGGQTVVSRLVMRDHWNPSIPTFTATWARRNRCGPRPVESRLAADVTRLDYTECASGADVALYTIHDGGHTWPGGGEQPEWFAGRTTHSVSASREAWTFFRAHPLAREPAGPTAAAGRPAP
jgi:poly(3-hydroxybutyrate) depolymerase